MRKKSAASKLTMHPDFISTELPTDSVTNYAPPIELSNISGVEVTSSEQSNENVTFHIDNFGNMTLSDGTPVVQPADVPDTTNYSLQFDLQDGVLPRRPFSNSFQIGSIDTVRCTSCAHRVSPFACTVHPHLSVILCKKCLKFYGKGEFAKDVDGKDENCRWCGDGGDLICCDFCSNAFCKSCIKRNLGRIFLQNIEDLPDDASWYCLTCNPSPLVALQQECAGVFDRVKALTEQARKRAESKRSRPVVPVLPKPSQIPNNQGSQNIATVVNMEFPEPRMTVSSRGKTAPVSCNSVEFYLKNASISGILDQISSVTPENFKDVVRSIRFCMESFSNDVKRAETNFLKAKSPEESQATVMAFQSIYRYHLLNRLGNVVSRVNEENSKKPHSAKSIPTPSETIDLTDDLVDGTNENNSETSSTTSSTKRRISHSAANSSTSTQVKRRKVVADDSLNGEYSQPSPVHNNVVEKLVSDANSPTSSTQVKHPKVVADDSPNGECSLPSLVDNNIVEKVVSDANSPTSSTQVKYSKVVTDEILNGEYSQPSPGDNNVEKLVSGANSSTSSTQVNRGNIVVDSLNGEYSQPSPVDNNVVEKLVSDAVEAAKSIVESDTNASSPCAVTPTLQGSLMENAQESDL